MTGWAGLLHPFETPKYEVYGGIQKDLEGGRDLFLVKGKGSNAEGPDTPSSQSGSVQDFADRADGYMKCMLFWTVDLPLTFVGDTLTLPITIGKSLEKRPTQSPPEKSTSP
jgi:uncharacterized protein YceK